MLPHNRFLDLCIQWEFWSNEGQRAGTISDGDKFKDIMLIIYHRDVMYFHNI